MKFLHLTSLIVLALVVSNCGSESDPEPCPPEPASGTSAGGGDSSVPDALNDAIRDYFASSSSSSSSASSSGN